MKKYKKVYTSEFDLNGQVPLKRAVVLGMQHVLAMFVGNLTPILVVGGLCGLGDAGIMTTLIQNAMLISGVVTMVQLVTIGPVGAKLPVVMGTSASFIGVMSSIAAKCGGGVIGYGTILGATFIGGLVESVIGFVIKPLRKLFPPLVTGIVVTTIGISLISVGINSFGGGNNNADFGSPINLGIAFFVLIVIIVLKHFTKGITSSASILFGIIAGYILCTVLAIFVPTTYTDAQGIARTCSWVVDWNKVLEASWFNIPQIMPVKMVFDLNAIVPMILMFVVTAVETIGDLSGITEGGLDRDATDKELSGGVICDGLGSSLAALFGALPNTSFSQNVGLVGITKVVNRFTIGTGAVFLILCGFMPKLATILQIMPQSVLGGAAVMMFASIIVSGVKLMTKDGIDARSTTIISVAIGVGYGLGSTPSALSKLPEWLSTLIGESGVVTAGVIAIILNILIPKSKKKENKES